MSTKRDAAERRRVALERGQALMRKFARLTASEDATPEDKTDRADEIAALADQLSALFAEYPDVYPHPPVSPDVVRRHVQELKEANAATRKAEQEVAELSLKVEDAKRKLDATLNEIASPAAKPSKPN